MTSNQIANRTNIENERHNVVVEAETERHNKASEQLQEAANNETATYHATMAKLQKDYNDALMAYNNASLEHKKEYENALIDIENQRNALTESHNKAMETLGQEQANIDRNYKEAVAWKGLYDTALEAKRVYYESQKTEAYVTSIGNMHIENMKRIQNEATKLQHERTLDMINQSRLDRQLTVLESQLDFTRQKWEEAEKLGVKSKAFRDVMAGIVDTTKAVTESLSKLSETYTGVKAITATLGAL